MKIYTKTGDAGSTGLFGAGRVSKTHPRIEAYGTVDELNSAIGVARCAIGKHRDIDSLLDSIQQELFVLGADLATPATSGATVPRVDSSEIERLEAAIDRTDEELEPLKAFVLPAGTPAASALHLARTICRRAERRVIQVSETENVNTNVAIYLNRLADLLFVLARALNARDGHGDVLWSTR